MATDDGILLRDGENELDEIPSALSTTPTEAVPPDEDAGESEEDQGPDGTDHVDGGGV